MADRKTREHLVDMLEWSDAHVSFEDAVRQIPVELRGVRPEGTPHSAWDLLEHIRVAQRDILDFCTAAEYKEREWPAEYWPDRPEPADERAWEESVDAYRQDLAELQHLALHQQGSLTDPLPRGSGQTYLRELLLVADHTAYHVGQLVVLRRLLGTWPDRA